MSKILTTALFGAITLGFAAAPVAFNASTVTLTVASAFAKNGADDAKGDDRGGNRDDGAGHTAISPSYQVAKDGADNGPGDDRGNDSAGHASLTGASYQFAKDGADDGAGHDAGDDHGRG